MMLFDLKSEKKNLYKLLVGIMKYIHIVISHQRMLKGDIGILHFVHLSHPSSIHSGDQAT